MKDNFYKYILVLGMVIFGGCYNLQASVISSAKSGSWDNPETWVGNVIPGPQDEIIIRHNISHPTDLVLGSEGRITVERGALLSIQGKFDNNGTLTLWGNLSLQGDLTNTGSIVQSTTSYADIVGGFRNLGTFNSEGELRMVGKLSVEEGAEIILNGLLDLTGDFMMMGRMGIKGTVHMTGDFHQYGYVMGSGGWMYVCGDAFTHSTGQVEGTAYLCVQCGGTYKVEGTEKWIETCSPFSISLNTFNAWLGKDYAVHLEWTTASESNSDHFEIMRYTQPVGENCVLNSCEGSNEYTLIGKVNAAGDSRNLLLYSFNDRNPGAGINHYQLKMVDRDGQEELSPVVEVFVKAGMPTLLIYPNPTHEILNLRFSGVPGMETKLRIYDISGRKIFEKKVQIATNEEHLEITVCDFAAGTYIVEYQHAEVRLTSKFVLQK